MNKVNDCKKACTSSILYLYSCFKDSGMSTDDAKNACFDYIINDLKEKNICSSKVIVLDENKMAILKYINSKIELLMASQSEIGSDIAKGLLQLLE